MADFWDTLTSFLQIDNQGLFISIVPTVLIMYKYLYTCIHTHSYNSVFMDYFIMVKEQRYKVVTKDNKKQ